MQRIGVLQVTEHGVWRYNDLRVDAAICSVDTATASPGIGLWRLEMRDSGVETKVEFQTGGNPAR